jgi:hypothetical protein
MKKTSRRDFGKLIAGAAAALPLTSISAGTLPKRAMQSHQDTPPDLILEQGSLIIDIKDSSLAGQQELPSVSDGYQWKLPQPGQGNIYTHAVKIVSGDGHDLFYVDRDHREKSENVEVLTLLLHMEGLLSDSNRKEVIVSTNRNYVTFKVPSGRKLKKNHQNNTPIKDPGSEGTVRFRYLDENGNAGNFNVQSIGVAVGPLGQHRVITRIRMDHLDTGAKGTKVMVWFRPLKPLSQMA